MLEEPAAGAEGTDGDVDGNVPFFECFDDVLTAEDQKRIDAFLHLPGWEFGWKSQSRRDIYSFWHKHFAGFRKSGAYNFKAGKWPPPDCSAELRQSAELIHEFWLLLQRTVLEGHTLVRCYANGLPFGSEGTLHTDSDSPNGYTCIYYPHQAWHPDWGGETVFFNAEHTDIVASIFPKPNRLLLFRGDTPHVARPVSRSCPELRVTLMFKTEKRPAGTR
ncbi:2OG-Fe(II) oxygenase [Paraburkholderia antibiotica]|uniref:2OG-Fe(II) oxygenase n=1 Tax=Paraburkholderia antibiotica TaxID=2728839 RepID=A0A7X9X6M6_9BURK|nr:2OG-Fe(II) oxygenase [Paraburkholderia antibiotica]NML32411.1 2OG-Fe(II) oxygenase [Paraburkholderia antibiotica]